MSGMNEFLASWYGTGAASTSSVTSEDVEKQAQVELFSKLAADNNLDLSKLSDAQVQDLWANFEKAAAATKVAEFPPKKEDGDKDDDGDKKEKAKEEHEEKKAAAEKLAEADFLGRVMAHSYVDELKKIASETTPTATEEAATEEGNKEAAMPEHLRKAIDAAKGHAGKAGKAVGEAAGKAVAKGKETGVKAVVGANKHKSEIGAGAAGAAVGAAGTAAAMHKKEKKASALDELACKSALQKVAEAGFDVEEAGTRLNAALQLPISENTKIASIPDLDSAIDFRSLELLEIAGYPVTWNNQ